MLTHGYRIRKHGAHARTLIQSSEMTHCCVLSMNRLFDDHRYTVNADSVFTELCEVDAGACSNTLKGASNIHVA